MGSCQSLKTKMGSHWHWSQVGHDHVKSWIFNQKTWFSVEEIEVSYTAVESAVDRIWEKDPLAVIHVGVAGTRKSIDLEIQSKNGTYNKQDVLGKIGCRDCKEDDNTVVDGPGETQKFWKFWRFRVETFD